MDPQIYKDYGIDENNVQEKWQVVKIVRNQLLKDSDWTQLPDAALTLEEKTAWQDYRQALRDIPQAFEDPDSVVFPILPGGA